MDQRLSPSITELYLHFLRELETLVGEYRQSYLLEVTVVNQDQSWLK